ncbi:MAG: protein kinase [Planctomycetes bacterium]|nr:protein kinase [Planctomycetota bacterium]
MAPDKKLQEFKSLREFLLWWNSSRVIKFRYTHQNRLPRIKQHKWVRPWVEQIESSDDPLAKAGKIFGNYLIEKKLGTGGMGVVYLAYDSVLKRKVAVKVIGIKGEAAVARFMREAQNNAKLKHPNIVQIYDVDQVDNQYYFTMEYIEGNSLEHTIANGISPMEPKTVAKIIRDIASALYYAHTQGLIHRDIKPSNILIDKEGKSYLTDFGLAKEQDAMEFSLTLSGAIMGTPYYMSPEQARGEKDKIDPRSDIFSLGATMYYALTGQTPFSGKELYLILEKVVHKEPARPTKWGKHIDRDIETICFKCMEKEASKRYQTAQELSDDLKRYISGEPITARSIGFFEKIYRKSRRNKIAAIAVLSTVTVLLALVVSQAVSEFKRIAQIKDKIAQATELLNQGKYDEVKIICNNILVLSPDNAGANKLLQDCENAVNFIRNQQNEKELLRTKAKGILDRVKSLNVPDDKLRAAFEALDVDPSFGEAWQEIGYIYKEIGELDSSLDAFNQAIAINPKLAYAYYERANMYYMLKQDNKKAIEDYEKVLELDPASHLGYFAKGTIELFNNNYDQAIVDFNKALEIKPDYIEAYQNKSFAYMEKNDLDAAVDCLNTIIGINPDAYDIYLNRAGIYMQKGDFVSAINDYSAVLSKIQVPEYYLMRGQAFMRMPDLNSAINDFTQSIKIKKDFEQGYYSRANAYAQKKDWYNAVNDAELFIKNFPKSHLVVQMKQLLENWKSSIMQAEPQNPPQ